MIEERREKKISVRLSDYDCERISMLCAEHSLTVGELLENFIADLVDGTYSNGSDERMCARKWFDRCWFGMFPQKTLLNFLIGGWQYEFDEFIELLNNIKTGYEDLEYAKIHPEHFYPGEVELLRVDIEDWEKELAEIKAEFLKYSDDANWEEEVEKVKKWCEETERLKNE